MASKVQLGNLSQVTEMITILTAIYRIMPELRGLLKNNDRALSARSVVCRGASALFDLMHLSIVLEPAGHYCAH